MRTPRRTLWLMLLTALLFFGAAFVTLRAAEQATQRAAGAATPSGLALSISPSAPTSPPKHPAPSTPEESATIADDPITAPDPSQSADNDVSFPTDI
jgi:hypothetical protein